MRILYGVQATGNGHITRARSMAPELERAGAKVDYLFSGRPADQLFDMAPFGTYQVRTGLTFSIRNGQMQYLRTLANANMRSLVKDIRHLNTRPYDLVLTDFEPITAWAARLQGTPSMGVGHQYAFAHPVPVAGDNPIARAIMQWFAPARMALGSHWHSFGAPILPPLITAEPESESSDYGDPSQVLVYLPFDDSAQVIRVLRSMDGYCFHLFCGDKPPGLYGNVRVHSFGRDSFQARLRQCPSVFCGAGFELTSEALHLGKRILVKPTRGQMEQASNAAALEALGLGEATRTLDPEIIRDWLENGESAQVRYPNVAAALAEWIVAGDWTRPDTLTERLWREVDPASFRAGLV